MLPSKDWSVLQTTFSNGEKTRKVPSKRSFAQRFRVIDPFHRGLIEYKLCEVSTVIALAQALKLCS